jgi:hypothetical protein
MILHRQLSISEAAATARVTRQAVHGWIARGHLTAITNSETNGYWIDAYAFDRFLATRHVAATKGVRIETIRHWKTVSTTSDQGEDSLSREPNVAGRGRSPSITNSSRSLLSRP